MKSPTPLSIVFMVTLSVLFTGCTQPTKPIVQPDSPTPIVGGDRDEHGCIGSAGYSWCEAKQKCLRTWEEKCEEVAAEDETTGWKTYTNGEYGFEIKYPEIWSVSPMGKLSSGDYLSISNVASTTGDLPNPNQAFLYIEIIPTNGKTLSAIIDDWFKTNPPIKKENVKIGGIDGIKAYRSNGYDSFVIKNDKVYNFGYIQSSSSSGQSLTNTFEIVISTFKFNNSQPVVGGDKDAHGCLGPAGYTWCEAKLKCLRPWEEQCAASAEKKEIDMEFTSSACNTASNYDNYVGKSKWVDGVLYVEAHTGINCCNTIEEGSYEINGNKITLKFKDIGEDQCNCICSHDLLYKFSNLENKEYQFELLPQKA